MPQQKSELKIREIKRTALTRLSKCWGQSAVVVTMIITLSLVFVLLQALCFSVFDYFGLVSSRDSIFGYNPALMIMNIAGLILGYVMVVPGVTGGIWWFLHSARGEKNSVGSMLVAYSNKKMFRKTLIVNFNVLYRRLLITAVAALAVYSQHRVLTVAFSRAANNIAAVLLAAGFALLTVCMAIFFVIFFARYSLVSFIFVLNPDLPVRKLMRLSDAAMREHIGDAVRLVVSFLPMLACCLLLFPIIFVIPYFCMSYTELMNRIIELHFDIDGDILSDSAAERR